MPLNLPNFRPLSASEAGGFGGFDLNAAIKSGLGNYKLYQQAKNEPAKLREALIAAQLQNQINQPKANHAEEITMADLQNTRSGTGLNQANINRIAQDIMQKREATQRQNNLINLIRGGQPNATQPNGSGHPGHMTPHGYEGSLTGASVDDFYANTGPDRQAEQEAVDRIDRANNGGNMESSIPSIRPTLAQNLNQGLQNTQGNQSQIPGNTELDRMNYVYDNYPSARKDLKDMGFVREKTKELPHEKMERQINTANIKEQTKINIIRAQQISELAKDLTLAGIDTNGIHEILTGQDSLGTGITKTLIGKLGWGSEKLGAFNERALRLQAQMARALSSRGGVGAANIVASGKPSTWKSTSENIGITDAYADHIKNEFDLLNQEYKSLTGKSLPYTLPEYVQNIGKKVDDNIFKPKTVFNSADEYHSYMKSLPPNQQNIVIEALKEKSKPRKYQNIEIKVLGEK